MEGSMPVGHNSTVVKPGWRLRELGVRRKKKPMSKCTETESAHQLDISYPKSDSKEAEAHKLGAHYVHNTKQDGVLKKIAGSLDLIISTVNAGLDVPGLLDTLAPKGRLHNVGAVLDPLQVPAFSLIAGQKSVSGSPTGSPTAIDDMLEFSARHSIAPITETFPMSQVNEALEHLRAGKARYRIVLVNDAA